MCMIYVHHSVCFPFPSFLLNPPNHHPSSSSPASYFISNFDGHILCSESPLVSVRPPAMVLFITVSSLPRALRAPWASPSRNDQMWPGPWSLCQPRTGGQPRLVGIPRTPEREGNSVRQGREVVVACGEGFVCECVFLCVCVKGMLRAQEKTALETGWRFWK